ncbi:MAG TPA: pantetheine-phosphate adenylyltransferase [Catalimonadaceae bacterium]|nr:pantetheine-phosphate adenylyltransferase [Catalimonadaceae bacterium]HPI10476.1 pantetheine-phosphate adenylyltransferase [Catalimonadaceae bacterium]
MTRKAIFPGSFDPFTKGHEDVVLRSLGLFDEIVIAIGHNSAKNRYFPLDLMVQKIEETFAHQPRISVAVFQGLTAHFARSIDAGFILRGLRNTTDFEYENSISQANRMIYDGLETVFLITSPSLSAIRSTIVRDLHKYGGPVNDFLPYQL